MQITNIHSTEILDSRGNPTVEVEVILNDGTVGRGMVPSGASTGEHEALELRDKDKSRYLGKGVLKAVKNVNETIAAALKGKNFSDVTSLDKVMLDMDGTAQKSKLGANAILGVSLAYANAVAKSQKRPLFFVINEWMGLSEEDLSLPVPMMNVLNGGLHANNGLEIQEFMIVPHGFGTFKDALRAGCEVFHHLKNRLHDSHLSTAVGDEGGFAPELENNEQALRFIAESIEKAGYQLGKQVSLALDVAASSFFESGKYKWGKGAVSSDELMNIYGDFMNKYPLVSIEDGLNENDWAGWKTLTDKYGSKVQLVGDDLFVTQKAFLERGIKERTANAILIKVNQVGSLSETFDTMNLARKSKYKCVVSHRSGETEDVTIAHLAVASGAGQIKTGSASRSERMAKYNELLRIEEYASLTKKNIPFAGKK